MSSTSKLKIKITKPRTSIDNQQDQIIPAKPRKRSRVGSDEDSDNDSSLSPPPPATSRPRRAAASVGGKSVATDGSDDEFEGTDDEGLMLKPNLSRAPSKNSKVKPRRRIQSDVESSPDEMGRSAESAKGGIKSRGKGPAVKGGAEGIAALYKDERSGRIPGVDNLSTSGKVGEPAAKKRKLPPMPQKRAPPGASSNIASSSATPPTIMKNLKSMSRPVNTNLSGSTDVDLMSITNITALMKSHRPPPPGAGDVQATQYEALRAEARKARLAANHKTFDLMAGSEKIKAFEAELERMGVWPMPQVLLSAITLPPQGTPSRPP
ncbi:hypothetical protein FRB95_006286 [Tulasnella sp. JGI-2019a]|nr:hypothetical protein FRB95_006286 [Tulasnella sp. JGI-2019a]